MLAQAPAASVRVLVVDDEPEIVTILTEFLIATKRGYAVEGVSSAVEALDAIRRQRPALVLLDVNMPNLDGVDALRAIRGIDPTIRVIMVTGADHRAASAALASGAFAYIPKPFELRYIEQLVAAAVGR